MLELQPKKITSPMRVGTNEFSPDELTKAIQYQLTERLQFVKPPDPAVASLLFDYAAIEAATKSMESAKRILQMATEYGYPPAQVSRLLNEFDRRLAWASAKKYGFYGLAGAAVIAVLVFLFKRGDFQGRFMSAFEIMKIPRLNKNTRTAITAAPANP